MSEIERLHQERLAREAAATGTKPGERPRERRDPTEWRPRGVSDDREHRQISGEHLRSQPLNYGTLVGKEDSIAAIEATARAELIAMAERQGFTVGERGVRVHWQLVVDGYGFSYPEGFIHPEAPEEIQHEGRAAWKRVVEIASDSMERSLFLALWRRRSLPKAPPMMEITAASDDDVVDAEIVEEPRMRRRTEAEARRCSQEGCPGDGRYHPPGKGHRGNCPHDAVSWVWAEAIVDD